jgi:hypothetical protein
MSKNFQIHQIYTPPSTTMPKNDKSHGTRVIEACGAVSAVEKPNLASYARQFDVSY